MFAEFFCPIMLDIYSTILKFHCLDPDWSVAPRNLTYSLKDWERR